MYELYAYDGSSALEHYTIAYQTVGTATFLQSRFLEFFYSAALESLFTAMRPPGF